MSVTIKRGEEINKSLKYQDSVLIVGKKLKTTKDRVSELEERVRRLEERAHPL